MLSLIVCISCCMIVFIIAILVDVFEEKKDHIDKK